MSVLSASLNSSLAMVGISAANPDQLTAIRNTVDGIAGSKVSSPDKSDDSKAARNEEKAAKAAEPEFTPAELRRIAELKRTDAEVRAHEQAHITVGRGLITSGPTYEYTYGPDGKQYAVAGEVGIDTSPEREPQENIDKGQHIQDTALAPVDPSSQDYRVAATGRQLEEQGRRDLRELQRSETEQQQSEQQDRRLQAYASPVGEPAQVDVYA